MQYDYPILQHATSLNFIILIEEAKFNLLQFQWTT